MKNIKIWTLIVVMVIQMISPAVFADINVDIPVPEFRAAVLDIGEMENLDGYVNGVELLQNSKYDDISENPFEKNIIRMAAQGIASRQGDGNFKPEDQITGFEAMKYFVRLSGGEAVVQNAVLPLTGGLSQGAIDSLYSEEYATQAQAQGILLPTEYSNMNMPSTREQLAIWVARTINLAPVVVDLEAVFGFNDYALVTPENRGLVEALLRSEIMTSGNDGNFDPRGDMTRGEFMEVLDAASENLYAQNGIATNYGLVTGVQDSTTQEVGYLIDGRALIIRNVDGSATALNTNLNTQTNQRRDFVVYKNDMSVDSSAIFVGDEIQYFTKNGEVIYAEVIDDNTILEKIKLSQEQDGVMTTYFGSIYETLEQKHWIEDRFIDSKRYRVRTFDGQTFDLVVETDLYSGVTNDMIVYKDNQIGGIALLSEGDDISFVVKNNDSVVYVSAIPLWQSSLSGTVRYVTTDAETGQSSITVFGYDDVIYEYPVASYVNVTVNETFAKLDDLLYGQDVSLDLNQGYVTNIESETFMSNPGYIPKYGKVRLGKVFAVFPAGIVFEVGDKRISYDIPDGIPMTKGGIAITKYALKEGDSVKLFFDDIYTDRVSKMEVEGIERLIQQVYKGRLGSVNETKQSITLYEPKYLKNLEWLSTDNYSKELKLSDNAEVFVGNLPIALNDLERDHRNQVVYVVVEDSYGDSVASKVSVKYGGENVYSDTIRTVNDALGSMELENRINMNLTKGTIVVKDSRFIDPSLLSKKDNVLVVSEYQLGENNANIIKLMTSTEDIFERIYIGAIETVGGNYFTIRNWANMDDNEWNAVDDSASDRFYYHTSSVLKDITDFDAPKTIKPTNFFHDSYARVENKGTDKEGLTYERYYGVLILKDEEGDSRSIVAMNMKHKGFLENQNIDDKITDIDDIAVKLEDMLEDMFLTRGVVDSIDTTWERIKLTDSNDWFSSVAEWRSNTVDTYVEYPNALVIRGNDVISIDDLEAGDNVSILRNDEKAQVIFVESE